MKEHLITVGLVVAAIGAIGVITSQQATTAIPIIGMVTHGIGLPQYATSGFVASLAVLATVMSLTTLTLLLRPKRRKKI